MTIREVEERARIERANIRFYEKEGLVVPKRLENGYRDYSEEDLEMLLKIRLLRSLQVPLEEIRRLKDGQEALEGVLDRQLKLLEQQKQNLDRAREICRRLQIDRVSFAGLDAKKYLEYAPEPARGAPEEDLSFLKADVEPRECRPFRRYFARMLDLSIYSMFLEMIKPLVFSMNLASWSAGWMKLFTMAAALLLMLLIEPLLLGLFRTTPGKWIFGIRIESALGRKLTYREGFDRTWGVIWYGMGAQIPLYSLYRLYKSFDGCSETEGLAWEQESLYSYTFLDTRGWRCALYVFAKGAVLACTVAVLFARLLPPNRGKLTVEEFAENVNFYAEYFSLNEGEYMDAGGQWQEKEEWGASVVIDTFRSESPDYTYILDGEGNIREIAFTKTLQGDQGMVDSYGSFMELTVWSFAGARKESNVFSPALWKMLLAVGRGQGSDFALSAGGMELAAEYDLEGYFAGAPRRVLFSDETASRHYFQVDFSLK